MGQTSYVNCVPPNSFTSLSLMEFSFPLHIFRLPFHFCLRTTLEPHSHSSWCSQHQRLTLDLASLFGLCQKKTLSNLMTLFGISQSHFCICSSVGFQQFVFICGVQYVLICWRFSHLCIGVGRTRDGWANRRERGKGILSLRNVACSAFSFVCMKQKSNYRDICMTLHDQQCSKTSWIYTAAWYKTLEIKN